MTAEEDEGDRPSHEEDEKFSDVDGSLETEHRWTDLSEKKNIHSRLKSHFKEL